MSEPANMPASGNRRSMMIIIVSGVVVLALAAWAIKGLMSGKSSGPKKPPKISLIAPPPPPPPPPPKFEKKPDPPKEQKEVKVDQPVPKDTPPPSPELKMDGPAGSGPSAFAAGKITSDDLSKVGTGTGGEKGGLFNPFNNYSNLLKGELQRYLSKNNALRRRRYAIEVKVWVSPSGALKRYELAGTTDDSDTDQAIQQALASLTGFNEAPPANMPQPIRLRIVTSG